MKISVVGGMRDSLDVTQECTGTVIFYTNFQFFRVVSRQMDTVGGMLIDHEGGKAVVLVSGLVLIFHV